MLLLRPAEIRSTGVNVMPNLAEVSAAVPVLSRTGTAHC
jgi:hypothetical protein